MKINQVVPFLPLFALSTALATAQQYVAVDLSPNATAPAMGFAVSGAAGGSVISASGPQHAAEFSGGSVSELHPAGWYASIVLGMSGSQQTGLGLPSVSSDASNGTHALLWSGSAFNVVDLHPNALLGSSATCSNGAMQGGNGFLKVKSSGKVKATPPSHALIWFGSAASQL